MHTQKLSFSFLTFLIFLISVVFAKEHFVSSGGDIQAAADNAEAGDVIVLEDGGEYTIPEYIVGDVNYGNALFLIDKKITIKAEEGASVKPQITWKELDLEGSDNALELRGLKVISTGPAKNGNYFINFTESFTYAEYVKVFDCEVSGFPRCAIRANRALNTCDEMIFDNCTFYGFDDSYRFFHFEANCNFSKFVFTNCTVSGFTEAFLWVSSLSQKRVIIDNCTFNDYTILKPSFIEIDGDDGSSITITDCIFTNFVSGKMFETWFFADTLKNCRFYSVGDTSNQWDVMENFLEEDPQYADPDNFDFTLPQASPLLTAGTDGGPIGDPRWAGAAASLSNAVDLIPGKFELFQNYPNPFNPTTTISYSLPKSADVTIKIYNTLGQEVRTLVNTEQAAGVKQITWDGKDNFGRLLSSGMYLCRFNANDYVQIKKMLILK